MMLRNCLNHTGQSQELGPFVSTGFRSPSLHETNYSAANFQRRSLSNTVIMQLFSLADAQRRYSVIGIYRVNEACWQQTERDFCQNLKHCAILVDVAKTNNFLNILSSQRLEYIVPNDSLYSISTNFCQKSKISGDQQREKIKDQLNKVKTRNTIQDKH